MKKRQITLTLSDGIILLVCAVIFISAVFMFVKEKPNSENASNCGYVSYEEQVCNTIEATYTVTNTNCYKGTPLRTVLGTGISIIALDLVGVPIPSDLITNLLPSNTANGEMTLTNTANFAGNFNAEATITDIENNKHVLNGENYINPGEQHIFQFTQSKINLGLWGFTPTCSFKVTPPTKQECQMVTKQRYECH
jgi:hypothetical protein